MKISKETKARVRKKIKSLELQIKSISKDIEGKWQIREEMQHNLFKCWQEIDETKPKIDAEEKEGEQ